MTLTEFLLARIAEDERAVDVPGWYCTDSARGEGWGSRGDECPACGAYMFDGTEAATEDAWENHMADRHGRVLAEVEAKRRIVAAHPLVSAHDLWGDPMDGLACEVCDEEADLTNGGYELEATGGCVTLRALALPYADHPDWREEWKH